MQPAIPFQIRGQQLWLSPHRCVFWESERSLILSDLHFGKTGHFRKAGIAVPQSVYREDLLRLLSLIQYFQPERLLVVGDLFHSRENKELDLFLRWREDFAALNIQLVLGNHDILHEGWYAAAGIELTEGELEIGPFAFIHDIGEVASVDKRDRPYYFSGHLHPGIRVNGMGKQSLQFPCFYFGAEYAILPAFGRFTGTVSIEPGAESSVFAILPSAGGQRMDGSHERRAASIFQIQ